MERTGGVMIDPSEFEQRRSPSALREFVHARSEAIRANPDARELGTLKKGAYKKYVEELVPLSCFAVLAYPDSYEVQLVLGNQGFDARVFDEVGREVDRVEITAPHDGRAASQDAALVVERGFGKVSVGKPGEDFDRLVEHVLSICRKKACADYNECTLVVAIEPLQPFHGFEDRYESRVEALVSRIQQIPFKAKRVFLLVLPDRLEFVSSPQPRF